MGIVKTPREQATATGTVKTPLPGTIGLTPISGDVGKAIEVLQDLNGEGFERWEHAFTLLPGNLILEAEPGGARIVPLHYTDVYWCHNIRNLMLTPANDRALLDTAEQFKGVGYSALDYGALVLHRFHMDLPGLRTFIADSKHEICSQMCDDFYQRLAVHIFTDDRWNGYVTPASLYRRDLLLGGYPGLAS